MDLLVKSLYKNIFGNLRIKLSKKPEAKDSGDNPFSLLLRTRRAIRATEPVEIKNTVKSTRNYHKVVVQKLRARKIRKWLKSLSVNTDTSKASAVEIIQNTGLLFKHRSWRHIGPDPLTKLISTQRIKRLMTKHFSKSL